MIILVNGAFGVGKTTLGGLLVERIPHRKLYDPEQVSPFLRAVVGDPVAEVLSRLTTVRSKRAANTSASVERSSCLLADDYATLSVVR